MEEQQIDLDKEREYLMARKVHLCIPNNAVPRLTFGVHIPMQGRPRIYTDVCIRTSYTSPHSSSHRARQTELERQLERTRVSQERLSVRKAEANMKVEEMNKEIVKLREEGKPRSMSLFRVHMSQRCSHAASCVCSHRVAAINSHVSYRILRNEGNAFRATTKLRG